MLESQMAILNARVVVGAMCFQRTLDHHDKKVFLAVGRTFYKDLARFASDLGLACGAVLVLDSNSHMLVVFVFNHWQSDSPVCRACSRPVWNYLVVQFCPLFWRVIKRENLGLTDFQYLWNDYLDVWGFVVVEEQG